MQTEVCVHMYVCVCVCVRALTRVHVHMQSVENYKILKVVVIQSS